MDGGFSRVVRLAAQLSMVVLLTSIGALAGVAIHTRQARAIDWYNTGLYSYDPDSDCPPASVENIKDPITVVFVGAASWQAVREHALQHGLDHPEDPMVGEQRYRDNGNCGFEHVDTASAGDNSHRFHLRARQGMLLGEAGPDLDPDWGMYSVGTPHRDQLVGPDDIWNGCSIFDRHYVPENFEGHGYSGFVAGRLFIYQNWVSTDHHRLLHTEIWYNNAQIQQCNGERPQSDGIVYYIEVAPDTDGDGVPDWRDNCPAIANYGQADFDGDGIGNVCELDVDCDGDLDVIDGLFILHYVARLRQPSDECPPPPGSLNGPRASAYVAYPGGTVLDALMALRCVVGYHNIVCPAAGGGLAPPATGSAASGQGGGPTVGIEDGQIPAGGTEVTRLSALGVADPPVCGVTVDVSYDRLVKLATDCEADPEGNFDLAACNVDYASDTVRVAVAHADGITDDIPLLDITWCALGSAGESSDLDVRIVSFLDCADTPAEITPVAEQDGVNIVVAGPPPLDSDNDGFGDCVEAYVGTDRLDNCPDVIGSDDAWPLDINKDRYITMADVSNFSGHLGATAGPPPSPNWWPRLDLNTDGAITMADVSKYNGMIGRHCT